MKGNRLSRRDLLYKGGCALGSLLAGNLLLDSCKDGSLFSLSGDSAFVKPARHWRSAGDGKVQCLLCPNRCLLNRGEKGACRDRQNRDGRLYTLVYSRIAALQIDPVEKKPFFHFLPGSSALSAGVAGCNFYCKFCQNWQLSQFSPEDLDAEAVSPSDLASRAVKRGTPIVAFTYNEPTVQFEYVVDAAAKARARGLKSVIISNGYISAKPGREFARALDGIKIDLKAFRQKFYSDICGGSLKEVMRNLELVRGSGRWLEIVVLIIPGLNDSPSEIREMTRWVAGTLSPDVPMHFTRFHSTYLMRNLPPTPVSTLERCREIARSQGVRYAYVGNVPGHRWENTYCHSCGRVIIKRGGFYSVQNLLRKGRCPYCRTVIPGVWV